MTIKVLFMKRVMKSQKREKKKKRRRYPVSGRGVFVLARIKKDIR